MNQAGPHDELIDLVPRREAVLLRHLGLAVLKVLRWKIAGPLPNLSKFVVIAAPHTSNWDFVIGISATLALDVDAHWIGKHTIFRWPFGSLMRKLGGIPVDRRKTSGLVEQIVGQFSKRRAFVLGLAPEGTRKSVTRWKSGFYHIAAGADVPIVCGYFDYRTREVGIGPVVFPSGDYEKDLARILSFYAPFEGKRLVGP